MFEGNDSVFKLTLNQFPQTFLTNSSELRIYILCKIPTVITETLIV